MRKGLIFLFALSVILFIFPLNKADAAIDVNSNTGWTTVYPLGNQYDPVGDQQTGSSTGDIVGNNTYAPFFINYDSNAGEIAFRVRVNGCDGNTNQINSGNYQFGNFFYVGVNANNKVAGNPSHLSINFFVGINNPTGTGTARIAIYDSDPNKLNISPSTTGIGNILKSYTPIAGENYSLMVANDGSNFSGNPDYFVTFKIPVSDINSNVTIASKGININGSTPLNYIVGTGTQDNSFNQDICGLNSSYSTSAEWDTLGAFAPQVTMAGTPVVAAPTITSLSPTQGPTAGGTQVTIAGSNLTGTTSVTFGGTAGTNVTVAVDGNSLTVATPSGTAGAVDVVVTTPGGTVTKTGAYTYVAAPTITSLSPTQGPTAGGTQVTIAGSNLTGTTSVTFGGTKAVFYTVDLDTQITAITPVKAAGAVDVSVTTVGGTSTDVGAYTYVAELTIDDSPASPPSTSNTVNGRVIDGESGTEISNVQASVTTNSQGNLDLSIPAEEALIFQRPDGINGQFKDLSKIKVVTSSGSLISTVGTDGAFHVSNLLKGSEQNQNIIYDFGNGQTIIIGTLKNVVDADGNVDLTISLIDPYGVIRDEATGDPIAGVNLTLYYADTERNKEAGKTPGTVVPIPVIDGFEPNDNHNPQTSDDTGNYAFMVYPYTDYYIVATKDGYLDYTSPTISVETTLVLWHINMHKTGTERIAALNKVDTALAVARATYPNSLENVILATAITYPDALVGTVLANKLKAPILLVGTSNEDQAKVLDYLKENLDPSGNVYILGGTAVVTADMEAKVRANGYNNIIRLAGLTRYDTAVEVANYLNVPEGSPVVLVSGRSFPDALSISSTAAINQYPILLVYKDSIPDNVKAVILKIKPSKIYIVGLQAAVSDKVQTEVAKLFTAGKPQIIRIGGYDQYETSLKVAQYFYPEGNIACFATGKNFPDALTGSVYAAKNEAPVILVNRSLSTDLMSYLNKANFKGLTIFGGEAVVSQDIEQQLSRLFKP